MKKSSKILGSVAVSAALVMGTAAPAFADVLTDAQENSDKQNAVDSAYIDDTANNVASTGSKQGAAGGYSVVDTNEKNASFAGEGSMTGASTVVNVSTYTSQITVTVPLALPVQLDTAGGVGYAPSNGSYYIQNNSTISVKVTDAQYAIASSEKGNWTFGIDKYLAPTTETHRNAQGTPAIGSMYVKLTPQVTAPATATPLELKANGTDNETGTVAGLDWVIADKDTNDGKLMIDVAAGSSTLKKSVDKATTAAGIVYTVAKA